MKKMRLTKHGRQPPANPRSKANAAGGCVHATDMRNKRVYIGHDHLFIFELFRVTVHFSGLESVI